MGDVVTNFEGRWQYSITDVKITLLGGIKRMAHHAGGISTAGNALHMKNVNDLIHKRKKMKTQKTQPY